MNKTLLICSLFSLFFATVSYGNSEASSSHEAATEAEIDNDAINNAPWSFLHGTAQKLKKSDIVLVVIIYKYVQTDQGTTIYARVIQSLRGEIPVEALIKWGGHANKLPAGSPPKTTMDDSWALWYVLASSGNVEKMPKAPEDFEPADSIFGIGAYDLKNIVGYFPMTESDPGRALQKLLKIEPAKITAESEAARFQPDSGK